ncbi:MAG: cytochrome c oxidase subunit [Gemmatimonadetes bacterium]|jgi:cbb3-type cytochrome oxidase subunit 1|nr:cytochrome c oxidase subunit [Gemmatimonadota bacterium]
MEWFVRAFLKASLAWLALGVTLGVAMAAHPAWALYRLAHVHMNLLGFVTMMIYGIAYHVIPRFSGHPLWSRRLAVHHWWCAQAGLAGMVTGFVLRATPGVPTEVSTVVLAGGGALSAAGAYAFALNLWRTIDGVGAAGKPPAGGARRPRERAAPALPVLPSSAAVASPARGA